MKLFLELDNDLKEGYIENLKYEYRSITIGNTKKLFGSMKICLSYLSSFDVKDFKKQIPQKYLQRIKKDIKIF